MKTCSKCKIEKPQGSFDFNKAAKDGLKNECRDCARVSSTLSARRRRDANPEEWKAKSKVARQKILDKNPNYYREYDEIWRPEYNASERGAAGRKSKGHNYRARKMASIGSFTLQEFIDLCRDYGNVCLACGADSKLTADHIMPLIFGGANDISNIQPLCMPCNAKKHTKFIDYRFSPPVVVDRIFG